jgi:amidase
MTGTRSDLCQLSATGLAAAIRSGEASSREVIEAHLRRIEAVNPTINAVTAVLAEQALAAAALADQAVAAGDDLPPLHGVPFTVKESIDLAGSPTTQGLRALAAAYPARDAPAVERLRAAGAIPIGHTNCPNATVRWHCDSELWGATVNPWDRSRTPGASSGGEAAALATGMSPLGLGSDGLGSLRWPAQCCGVSTLKPTLGRIPQDSSAQPIGVQLTVVVGPLARRVADLRAAFTAMAGPSWQDPWTVPVSLRGPDPASPVRVAVVTDPAGLGTAGQVRDGVQKAAAALADAGYLVEEAEPPSIAAAAATALDMLNTPEIRAQWQLMAAQIPADTQRFLTAFYQVAGDPDPVRTLQGFITRHSLLRAWGQFQLEHPLILAPVYTGIPFTAGSDLDDGQVAETIRGMRMVIAVNALGLPAVALPAGIGAGLPQSVQLIGPRYREDLCLDAAAALEERAGIITPIDPR